MNTYNSGNDVPLQPPPLVSYYEYALTHLDWSRSTAQLRRKAGIAKTVKNGRKVQTTLSEIARLQKAFAGETAVAA